MALLRIAKFLKNMTIGALVFLVSFEFILRIFYFGPDAIIHFGRYEPLDTHKPYFLVLSSDPKIAVELRPNHEWFFLGQTRITNELGLADPRSISELTKGKNILIMGESFAEGGGVRLEDRFSARVESRLKSFGPYHVINMAITNYAFESQIELLRKKLLKDLHPDLVIVTFLAHGNLDAGILEPQGWKERIESATHFFPVWKRLFSFFIFHDYWIHSEFNWNWLNFKLKKWAGLLSREEVVPETPRVSLDNTSAERIESLLRELKALGEKSDFKVVLSPLSHVKDLSNLDRNSQERRQLEGLAEKLEIPYFDLFPALDGKDPRYCTLWSMNRHMNAYAHELVADRLAYLLTKSQLLEK